jgi:hypothetical protein
MLKLKPMVMLMSNRFLAEDFRKIMDSLDQLIEAPDEKEDKPEGEEATPPAEEPAEPEQDNADAHSNVDDLLISKRSDGLDKSSVTDVISLIDYLDQFPELKDYRNYNAEYDDAYYSNLTLDKISKVTGLSHEDLKRASDQTESYEGSIWIHKDNVTIFGGD